MSFQRLMLKSLLSLPDPLLIRMSGGRPLEIDGRRLDAKAQFLAAQAANAPALHSLTPLEARQATSLAFALLNAPRPSGVETRDDKIPGPGGDLPVRHYRPKGASGALPALVYFHMGGWVIGDLDSSDSFCALLAKRGGAHVMSVDYRLAPEHKFPAAMEDGIAAYKWIARNAASLKVDGDRVAVGGDSAGGGISAVICHEAKSRGYRQPKAQMLIYPAVDLAAVGGSMESCRDCYPLTRDLMLWFGGHFLEREESRVDVMASPLRREDFSELAPALLITAGFDVLRSQGEAYAEKMREAGVSVRYRCYDSLVHGFTAQAGVVSAAEAACEGIARDFGKILSE